MLQCLKDWSLIWRTVGSMQEQHHTVWRQFGDICIRSCWKQREASCFGLTAGIAHFVNIKSLLHYIHKMYFLLNWDVLCLRERADTQNKRLNFCDPSSLSLLETHHGCMKQHVFILKPQASTTNEKWRPSLKTPGTIPTLIIDINTRMWQTIFVKIHKI